MGIFNDAFVLDYKNVKIQIGESEILKDITFKIPKTEFFYLVGQTGVGKSSLLKTIYADLPIRKGKAKVAGYNLKDISSKDIPFLRRKLGIIFQDFQLLPDRDVAENLLFVMKATGWKDRTKMRSKVSSLLMRVGLGSKEHHYPHQLSGGEQQRIVIARALINEPLMLIADEPTGNLDPEVADGIYQLFMEISKSGTSILMATHDYRIIKKYPHRVLSIKDGQLTEIDLKNLAG
jgi:cell division transport system ATP-binding protein